MSRGERKPRRIVIHGRRGTVIVEHGEDGAVALNAPGVQLDGRGLFRLMSELGFAMARLPIDVPLTRSDPEEQTGT